MECHDSDDEMAAVAAMLLHSRNEKRRIWTQPWLRRRQALGAFSGLSKELRKESTGEFQSFIRMEPHHIDFLLEKVAAYLPDRKDTRMRRAISKEERLQVTLRFLASGDTYSSLSYLYRISRQSLGNIIPETCEAICQALQDYLKVPKSQDEWTAIATDFEEKWNFPNCLGALDGKHISIKCPNNSGSYYYNYKHFYSIVLLALVDASYRIIAFDLGVNGRNSDAGVYANSALAHMLQENTNNIPPPQTPQKWHTPLPYVVVGDEAFPLKPYLMKPYPHRGLSPEERVFNYRLSRARRVSENAFGILVNRFAVLSKPMQVNPEVATTVTKACIALHNFLRSESDIQYAHSVTRDQPINWQGDIGQQHGNHSALAAQTIRHELSEYFNTEGAVSWQWDKC